MSFWNNIKNLRPQDIPRWEKLDLDLIKLVDQLITKLGVRNFVITSTYRTPEENAAVGGSSNSWHLQGKAMDIVFKGIDPLRVVEVAKSFWPGGIGIQYPSGMIHLDLRTTGQHIFGEVFVSAAKKIYTGFQEVLDMFVKKKVLTIAAITGFLGILLFKYLS